MLLLFGLLTVVHIHARGHGVDVIFVEPLHQRVCPEVVQVCLVRPLDILHARSTHEVTFLLVGLALGHSLPSKLDVASVTMRKTTCRASGAVIMHLNIEHELPGAHAPMSIQGLVHEV